MLCLVILSKTAARIECSLGREAGIFKKNSLHHKAAIMFYANPILNHDSGELRVLEFFNFEIDLHHQYIYTIGALSHKNIMIRHLNTDKYPNAMSGGQTVFQCKFNNAKIKNSREYS